MNKIEIKNKFLTETKDIFFWKNKLNKGEITKTDYLFKKTICDIIKHGNYSEGKVRTVWPDGQPAHYVYLTHVCETYDISKGEFPITSLRRIGWKSGIKEIQWIYQDQTSDLSVLKDKYNIHWWDAWESKVQPGTIGQRYGATVSKYNLMDKLLGGLKQDPNGRRHIINLWQYQDFDETDGLNPCAFQTTWTTRGEYLDLCLHQR